MSLVSFIEENSAMHNDRKFDRFNRNIEENLLRTIIAIFVYTSAMNS